MKYGEDEETFALQRAETGDARLNREHQAQRVNQQKEAPFRNNNSNKNSHRPNSGDREIFKGSSSSNFFNNRNGGKETEEDEYDTAGNVNANQDNDAPQRRKIIRKQGRRPQTNSQNNENNQQQNQEARTSRPSRPTGFTNNFAGSSPTTAKPVEGNNEQFARRNGNRPRPDNFRQNNNQQQNSETPAYVVSTPAPFRHTQQYNNINRQTNNGQYTTQPPKTTVNNRETENYPPAFQQKKPFYNQQKTDNYQPSTVPATQYNTQFEVTKVKQTKQTENYPTTPPQKQTTLAFQPKANFQNNAKTTQFNNQRQTDSLPTTFAPRTNAAYTQIAQQTTQYRQPNTPQYNTQNTQQYNQNTQQYNQNTQQYNQNSQANNQQQTTQYNNAPTTYNQQYDNTRSTNPQTNFNQQYTTPRTSSYTQYTPTVPKITTTFAPSTTTFARSNRFDETQYDDGTYDPKYDNYDRRDDELIKTAHSTNIANSRNEFAKSSKNAAPQSTPKPYYESPRPFSVSPATPKTTQTANSDSKVAQKPENNKKATEAPKKQTKNVSYDYAYYDTNSGSEIEYDIPTEIEKSEKVTKKQ